MKQKQLKLKSHFDIFSKTFEIVRKILPGIFIIRVLQSIFKSIIPYIAIFMSAKILSELVSGKRMNVLIVYVAITIGATLLAVIIASLLGYVTNKSRRLVYSHMEMLLNDKAYSIDYSIAEQKEVHELREKIEVGMSSNVGGINSFFNHLQSVFDGVFSVMIAALLIKDVFIFNMVVFEKRDLFYYINQPLAGVIVILLIVFSVGLLLIFQLKTQKKNLNFVQGATSFNIYLDFYQDSYLADNKSAKDVRIFNQSNFIINEILEKALNPFFKYYKEMAYVKGNFHVIHAVIIALLGGIIYIFVALKAAAGLFSVGDIFKYYGVITQLILAVTALLSAAVSLINNNEYIKMLFRYLDYPSISHNGVLKVDKKFENIELQNVSFRYSEKQNNALENISFTIRAGERIAIVGRNGSGKTTLIKLLCGFYTPMDGQIFMNGRNIKEYDYEQYKKQISVVFQDFRLFAFPVGQNVAGTIAYDAEKVWTALDMAGIKKRVEEFPQKLDQPLYKDFFADEGMDISGGEAQKIAIARALYKDAPIVLLDEPTAALDPFAEEEIYEKFDKMVHGKTAIYISHRLSSCKFCDRIIVLDHGNIVQMGTHEQLLQDKAGKYFELWDAQAKYYTNKNKKVV